MLRVKPTVISLTLVEIRDIESVRRRKQHRKPESLQNLSTSSTTVQAESSERLRLPSHVSASPSSQSRTEKGTFTPDFDDREPLAAAHSSNISLEGYRSDEDLSRMDPLSESLPSTLDGRVGGADRHSDTDNSDNEQDVRAHWGDWNMSTLSMRPLGRSDDEKSRDDSTPMQHLGGQAPRLRETRQGARAYNIQIDVQDPTDELGIESLGYRLALEVETDDRLRTGPCPPARRSSLNARVGGALPPVQMPRSEDNEMMADEESLGAVAGPPLTIGRWQRRLSGSDGRGHSEGRMHVNSPGFQVYSDMLSASSQPQTPQNLPEARHQSRLQGSYTLPARRASARSRQPPGTGGRARRVRRSPSPPGLQTPGFLGLYGGAENGDDAGLFEEALRVRDPGDSALAS